MLDIYMFNIFANPAATATLRSLKCCIPASPHPLIPSSLHTRIQIISLAAREKGFVTEHLEELTQIFSTNISEIITVCRRVENKCRFVVIIY